MLYTLCIPVDVIVGLHWSPDVGGGVVIATNL